MITYTVPCHEEDGNSHKLCGHLASNPNMKEINS